MQQDDDSALFAGERRVPALNCRRMLQGTMNCCLTMMAFMNVPLYGQDEFRTVVIPFFGTYCEKCHTGDMAEGSFRVDPEHLPATFDEISVRKKWAEVVNVLNSHSMPPESEQQPDTASVAGVVDWITSETVRAELKSRSQTVVLRRLNRTEYRNTIRDLTGVDFDSSGFPEDPAAGGFDNNGNALSISPMQIEMYLSAARDILDRALISGDRPEQIHWTFNPQAGPADRVRVRIDPRNNPLVNGNNNTMDGEWVVVHHNSWDTSVGVRDFRVPVAGLYRIRVKAAGRVPDREQVVDSARNMLVHRRDEQDRQNPRGRKFTQEQMDRDLEHFLTDRMYDYGPPRIKLIVQLGAQPRTIAEIDADGTVEEPTVHEFLTRFTTETAGISIEYAYSIPAVLENFWMQRNPSFARPELLIDFIELEGPVFDSWPPASHTAILPRDPEQNADELQYAFRVLERFMRRAFRRPVETDEIESRVQLFRDARSETSFVEAIKRPLISVLTSPHFLYMVEPAPQSIAVPLTDHQIAARMSYFLWSTMPDEELFQLADAGKLRDPAVRREQVNRMLRDVRADALPVNFAGQWLGLRNVGTNPPAADLYPQYDRHLETSMVQESIAYFREFLQHDLDVRQMIRSDFITINERLARFYGIPGVRGDQMRRVPVPPGVVRGGLVTQASVLTVTSNGTRTSPVRRGTWILKTLLGTDPGLPVANAGEIAPKVPGIDKATVRKRLEIHRELPQCARCHDRIDPLGFALENYNAAGEWRDREGFGYKGRAGHDDPLIDATSRMPDGTNIHGVTGLQSALLSNEDLFLRSLVSRLVTYALGREMGLSDQPTIQTYTAVARSDGYTLRGIIETIVCDRNFVLK